MSHEKRGSRDSKSSKRGSGSRQSYKQPNEENTSSDYDTNSPIIQAFLIHQAELDTKHDKYERLVKTSRDVTIESKRIIFLLHRIKNEEDKENTLKEAGKRLKDLQQGLLKKIATEIIKDGPYQFSRAYTAGIQEFVEAITFYFYEKEKRLPALQEVTDELSTNILENETEENVQLSHQVMQLIQPTDYILGIADLTGELMRKCINAIGVDQVKMPFELCTFLRQIHDGFVTVGNQGPREINRKLHTLKQSLTKVENACYTIQVRGSEIPKHMLADVFNRDTREFPRDEMESLYD